MLDGRRIAMLAEFGVRLPPQPWGDVRQEDTGLRVEPAMTSVARVEPAMTSVARVELSARAAGIELMEWDALADAVAACRACKLCDSRRNTVFGMGDRQADWLIVGEPPD